MDADTRPQVSAGSGPLTNTQIKGCAVAVFFFKAALLLSFTWDLAMKGNPACQPLRVLFEIQELKNLLELCLPSQPINLTNILAKGLRSGSAIPRLLLPFQQGTESICVARPEMALPIPANRCACAEILARVPEAASLWCFAWDNYLLNMGN